MNPSRLQTQNGSLLLFRKLGVDVFVHWSWLLAAVYQINRMQSGAMSEGEIREPLVYYILEYLCLFLIVLIHEYGHALACKSVGGKAERIVLWPLGGLAFVQPPPRPGATLWSVAAGPLVNVVLVPVLYGLAMLTVALDQPMTARLVYEMSMINLALLIFNMMPIYPLDGGQILRSLIWFFVGAGRSLMIAAVIGILGAAALVGLALYAEELWLGLIGFFMGMQSYSALNYARHLREYERSQQYP
ncbi:MAG: peptidase M50 [Planctomycetes bacterium]|nr:peptidase M50 [Planctomycetota bacterium]